MPNSALSSKREFAQAGPRPSAFTAQGLWEDCRRR